MHSHKAYKAKCLSVSMSVSLSVCEFCTYWDADASKNVFMFPRHWMESSYHVKNNVACFIHTKSQVDELEPNIYENTLGNLVITLFGHPYKRKHQDAKMTNFGNMREILGEDEVFKAVWIYIWLQVRYILTELARKSHQSQFCIASYIVRIFRLYELLFRYFHFQGGLVLVLMAYITVATERHETSWSIAWVLVSFSCY